MVFFDMEGIKDCTQCRNTVDEDAGSLVDGAFVCTNCQEERCHHGEIYCGVDGYQCCDCATNSYDDAFDSYKDDDYQPADGT